MVDAVRELGRQLGLDPKAVEEMTAPPRVGEDPRAYLQGIVRRLVRIACEGGDHRAELRLGEWRLAGEIDLDANSRGEAWAGVVQASGHVLDLAGDNGRDAALIEHHRRALEAFNDIERRLAEADAAPGATRRLLDPFVSIVAAAERELGLDLSEPARELAQRQRVRASRTTNGLSFAARHAEDLAAVRAAEAHEWYATRFADRHGVAPPEGWLPEPHASAHGAQVADHISVWIAPDATDLFDAEDHVAFLEETEARFRADRGLPARGEGWVSAASLVRCVQDVLPGIEIVREARMPWLGRQRLDILLPSLDLAIEYQGEQHYLPLEHWGGDAGLSARRELDERKRDACARAGVRLMEWRYDEPITVDRVRRRLQDAGALPLD